jgi:hypothetical protein
MFALTKSNVIVKTAEEERECTKTTGKQRKEIEELKKLLEEQKMRSTNLRKQQERKLL